MGVCVTQFDAKLLERGLVCSAGAVVSVTGERENERGKEGE